MSDTQDPKDDPMIEELLNRALAGDDEEEK